MSLLRFCDEKPLRFLLKCSIKRAEPPGPWRCPHVTWPAGAISLASPRTPPLTHSFITPVESRVGAGSLEPKFLENTVLAGSLMRCYIWASRAANGSGKTALPVTPDPDQSDIPSFLLNGTSSAPWPNVVSCSSSLGEKCAQMTGIFSANKPDFGAEEGRLMLGHAAFLTLENCLDSLRLTDVYS